MRRRNRYPTVNKSAIYNPQRSKAISLYNKALRSGEIERRSDCELCGNSRCEIVGHHWRGYDYPLDTLQICKRCNYILQGPEYHNGTVTKEQSRAVVLGIR